MISNRLVPVILAIGVGIGTGIYVFQPLLKEYEQDTKGTWILPEDEARLKDLESKKRQDEHPTPTEKQYPVSST
ncbi:hypothetical protein BCR42DRAFT_366964 [Absidia repens]|uniref:Uncharacterized protein n=1 Tax=Absidia repens TaxID=90262 RepID=A0A1X2IWA5_9FUNG|nr:hypothetical protein BCR42DRAFT_366964 [Absidia repens]